MKVTFAVIFSLLSLASVLCLPAKTDKTEEVDVIPLEKQNRPVTLEDIEKETYGDQPIVDTAAFDFSFSNPFAGFFQSFEDVMTRMRQQMSAILNNLPSVGGNGSEPFPALGFGPSVDLSKGNTTSVTKIIDGHKVIINETEYKNEGENGGAYFKVRIIDVKPDSSELSTEANAETVPEEPRDRESMENSNENEIQNNEVRPSNTVESFDEVDSAHARKRYIPDGIGPNWNNIETFYPYETNRIDVRRPQYYQYDLSRDTYVNDILAQRGAPVNPDAEVFSPNSIENSISPLAPQMYYRPQYMPFYYDHRFRPMPIRQNFKPVDLRNDVRVNYLTRNIPINPDAEVFDVNNAYNNQEYYPFRRINKR